MRTFLGTMLSVCLFAAPVQTQTEVRKVLSQSSPEYPALLKAKNIGGTVRLELVVTAAGTVRVVHILGGNPILAESAEKAVKKWKFAAGPTESKTELTIQFDPRR